MKVYLDVFALENFIVDMFLLLISTKILRIKYSAKRLVVASLVGCAYSVFTVFPYFQMLSNIFCQLLVGYLMVAITINRKKIMINLKVLAIYLLLSFTLSGISFSLVFLTNKHGDLTVSYKVLLLSMMILFIVSDRAITFLKERVVKDCFLYEIKIPGKEESVHIKGFLDTGNELREPVTNLPCIIIEERFISKNRLSGDAYYISYNGIGHSGKLKGYYFDDLEIMFRNEWTDVKAIVCPCKQVLSQENEFNALLSIGVI